MNPQLKRRQRISSAETNGSGNEQALDVTQMGRTPTVQCTSMQIQDLAVEHRNANGRNEISETQAQTQTQRPRRPSPLNLSELTENASDNDMDSGWEIGFNIWRSRGRVNLPFEFVTPHSPVSLFELQMTLV